MKNVQINITNEITIKISILIWFVLISINATPQVNYLHIKDPLVDSVHMISESYCEPTKYFVKNQTKGIWKVYYDTLFMNIAYEVEFDSNKIIYSKSYYKSGLIRTFKSKYKYVIWGETGILLKSVSFVKDTTYLLNYYSNGMIKELVVTKYNNAGKLIYLKECKWRLNGSLIECKELPPLAGMRLHRGP